MCFSPCPIKPMMEKKREKKERKKETCAEKNHLIFFDYVPVAVTCTPETLQY